MGIDPGRSSGAIAYVVDDFAMAWPISTLTDREIWRRIQLLAAIAKGGLLEHVWAMPKQGVSSVFKFGASFGELKMALIAAELRFELVTPRKWQMGVMKKTTKGDKKVSKAFAERRWPGLTITHKTADALLLAEYARRVMS